MKFKEKKYPNLNEVSEVKGNALKQIKGGCWTCTTCNQGGSVSVVRPSQPTQQ